jgi:hypothetical protein
MLTKASGVYESKEVGRLTVVGIPKPPPQHVVSVARYAKPSRGAESMWVGSMNLEPVLA